MSTKSAAPESGSRRLAISRLCAACGLCCDGTLYGRVTVDAVEAARIERRRLPMLVVAGERVLPQPCPAYEPGGCTVYDDRPRSCVRYECLLYRRVTAGEIGIDEAASRVTRARHRAAALRTLLPSDNRAPLVDALVALVGDGVDDARGRRENAELLLAAAALAAACRRDFDPRFGRTRDAHRDGDPE
jgi:uncharacterized protein